MPLVRTLHWPRTSPPFEDLSRGERYPDKFAEGNVDQRPRPGLRFQDMHLASRRPSPTSSTPSSKHTLGKMAYQGPNARSLAIPERPLKVESVYLTLLLKQCERGQTAFHLWIMSHTNH